MQLQYNLYDRSGLPDRLLSILALVKYKYRESCIQAAGCHSIVTILNQTEYKINIHSDIICADL